MHDVNKLVAELNKIGEEVSLPRIGEIANLIKAEISQSDEALASAGAIEIERKYLLSGLPSRLVSEEGVFLAQGYLPGERLVERVRQIGTGPQSRYVRTVKLGEGVARIEIEEACDKATFDGLWSLTEGRRIEKVRYTVPMGDLVWEIDAFIGTDLFLAEIELPTVETQVHIPEWLTPYLEREVTGERSYTNWALSRSVSTEG